MLYLELGKARLTGLVVLTTAVGFLIGRNGVASWRHLFWTVIGTALAAFGANALNQWLERRHDGRMHRTCHRPLPSGRLTAPGAWCWGTAAAIAGPAILAAWVNGLAAVLAAATVVIYLGLYTPLKTRSSFCTLVGAVCGAIPPMIGWSAATGGLEPGAWLLGAVLFAWQVPHFLALAWLHRDDYARGGFRMLPVSDPTGQLTGQVIILYSLTLLALGPVATLTGMTGWVYAIGSVALGAGLLVLGVRLYRQPTSANARRLFHASLVYLPTLFALMLVDRSPVLIHVTTLATVRP